MTMNMLASEEVALVGTIDPDAYAVGAQNSDYVDMEQFGRLMVTLLLGAMSDTSTTWDLKLQQATTSGGGGVKDITGKAITQIASGSPAVGDKQTVINLRADELDVNNGFSFVRAVMTSADSASPADSPVSSAHDACVILQGLSPRYGPASDNDLASVVEIIS